MSDPRIVDRESWIKARKALLDKEKSLTRLRDEVSEARRALPWVSVDKAYQFEDAEGTHTLAELFGPHRQLMVQHFMFGPDWEEGCPSCSFWADGFAHVHTHLAQRDIAFVVVSKAPFAKLDAYRTRLNWPFRWVSAYHTDFNEDFGVSFTAEQVASGETAYNYGTTTFGGEEAPGVSAFVRDEQGRVYHTYSTFSRGLDPLNPAYQLMDLAAFGRDEAELPYTMAWLRRRDQYDA